MCKNKNNVKTRTKYEVTHRAQCWIVHTALCPVGYFLLCPRLCIVFVFIISVYQLAQSSTLINNYISVEDIRKLCSYNGIRQVRAIKLKFQFGLFPSFWVRTDGYGLLFIVITFTVFVLVFFFFLFQSYEQNPWLINLIAKLLGNEKEATALIRKNPFAHKDPPR